MLNYTDIYTGCPRRNEQNVGSVPYVELYRYKYIQGVPGGMNKTSGVFLMLNYTDINIYRCPRRNGQNFGRVFLMLNYTDIYIQGVPGGMDKTSGECSLC